MSVRCLACRKADCSCRGATRKELRVYLGVDPKTGKKKWASRVVVANRRDVDHHHRKFEDEVRPQRARAGSETVRDVFERWFAWLDQQVKDGRRSPATVRTYRGYWTKNIEPAIGDEKVRKLTSADITEFLDGLGLSPNTRHHHYAILSAALTFAEKRGMVAENVARHADRPSLQVDHDRPAPTFEEAGRIFAAAAEKDRRLAVLLWLAAAAGCRRGELCALRRSHVDLDTGTLKVAASVSDTGRDRLAVKTTKTRRSREFALDPLSVSILAQHYADQEAAAEKAGVELVADPYLFSEGFDGSVYWRPDRVSGFFRRLRAGLGLEHVRMHDLRHFSATLLAVMAKVDPVTAARRLGHDPSVLMGRYAHGVGAEDRAAAASIGALLAPIGGAFSTVTKRSEGDDSAGIDA